MLPSGRLGRVAVDLSAFFAALPARVGDRAAGVTNSFLFEIDGAGMWLVRVDDGTVTVGEGPGEADCTIRASAENFERLLAGKQNPMTAYMTGKIKVSGDMGAAMKLKSLM